MRLLHTDSPFYFGWLATDKSGLTEATPLNLSCPVPAPHPLVGAPNHYSPYPWNIMSKPCNSFTPE